MSMSIGLLWWDNDPKKTLQQKAQGAVDCFLQKYGFPADTVYVNPEMIGEETEFDGYKIFPSRSVMRNHFWVGRQDNKKLEIQNVALDN